MKINIGGAKGRDEFGGRGFVCVDVRPCEYQMDITTQKLPFDDNTIDAIYTSNTLEHILPERIEHVFHEMYRVLGTGRSIRIVVPDIDKAIDAYTKKKHEWLANKNNPEKLPCLPNLPICYLNGWFFTYYSSETKRGDMNSFLGGHLIGYNEELINYYLTLVGFKNITRLTYNECGSDFQGCDMKRYQDNCLYVEATK